MAARSILGLVFQNTGTTTITSTGGPFTLSIGVSGVTVNSGAGTVTLDTPLILTAAQTWTNNSGTALTVGGTGSTTITRSTGVTLNFAGTGSFQNGAAGGFTVANSIIGPWATIGSGTGMQYATLSGSAIVGYTGGTSAATAANIGTDAAINYELAAGGSAVANASANTIRYTGGTDTLTTNASNGLTLNGLLAVGASGKLTIQTNPLRIGSTHELVIAGLQDVAISSVVQNNANGVTAGSLTYSGTGTLTLSGNNNFTGALTINSGTVAANTSAGALGGGTLVLNGGTLDLNHSAALSFNRSTTVGGNATIVAEKNAAGPGVTYGLGTLAIGSQTLTVQGGNVTSGTAGLTFGATTLSGNASFNVVNPTGGGATQLDLRSVAGSGSITKTGNGTLRLASNASYNGPTTVNSGTMRVQSPAYTMGDKTAGALFSNSVVSTGYDFTVAAGASVTILQLGYFDYLSNGISSGRFVAISDNSGTLLGSANIPFGTAAPLINTYRFAALSTPLTLSAGTYRIWASGQDITDQFAYNGSAGGIFTDNYGGLLSASNTGSFHGTVNQRPTTSDGNTYRTASFLVDSAKLPDTALNLGLAGTFDLAAGSQTVAALGDGTGGGGLLTNSTTTTTATVTLSGTGVSSASFSGTIQSGGANGVVNLALTGNNTFSQTLSGSTTVNTLTASNANATLNLSSGSGTITTLNVSAGGVTLGSHAVTTASITGGTVTGYRGSNSSTSSLTVSGASTSVTTGAGAIVKTADLSAGTGTVNAATNALTITGNGGAGTLRLANKVSASISSGSSFTASGDNLVDNSAARTLTLSGGTLSLVAGGNTVIVTVHHFSLRLAQLRGGRFSSMA